MTDAAPAVALLFDDTDLGGHLREALHERGARIVHEGAVSSLSRELLQKVGAEVLVVNLDDSADDALDHLYEVIDGDRPRVVFNDAQASRALVGWDRARWARHLAVKVLAAGDVDPPRPEDARSIEMPQPASMKTVADEAVHAEAPAENIHATAPAGAEPAMAAEPALPESDSPAHEDADEQHKQAASAESESLAAELEALLASDELPPGEEAEAESGLRYSHDEDLPPLHDGNFDAPAATNVHPLDGPDGATRFGADEPTEKTSSVTPRVFELNHLQLSPLTDTYVATIPAAAAEPAPAYTTLTHARAPDGWALLDDEAPFAASAHVDAGKSDAAAEFGIEKLSAADFLAPDVEQTAPGVEPVMNLQLESMEEAIAPQAYAPEHEMLLDDLGGALGRIVLLGAAASGTDSVCSFLAALPASPRLTFLHTQHQGEQSPEALAEKLAAHSALPVRLAEQNSRARVGEVWVVPAGQQVRLRRDGSIELQANGPDAARGPSIDASFTMAANAFGQDALAIVFMGRSTDAVAGAQAIHDRGGQVWVESSSDAHSSDMVSGICAERLVSFSGTPQELAAHLIEVFS